MCLKVMKLLRVVLKFTPLEFETRKRTRILLIKYKLKFTPLEFETQEHQQ